LLIFLLLHAEVLLGTGSRTIADSIRFAATMHADGKPIEQATVLSPQSVALPVRNETSQT
jgi:hypothetical protein